jgi:hypothetical protein
MLKESKVIFNKESHTYTLDGVALSGVTSLLSRTVFKDKYDDVPEAILQQAARRGTFVHECCEMYDNLGIETDSDEVRGYKKLCEDYDLKIEASEYLVSDNKHYASSIDKVYKDGDRYHLGDIKTTYKLDEEYVRWQLSIYAYLFELQNKGKHVDKLFAIYLRKEEARIVYVERIDTEIIKALMKADTEGRAFENPIERETLPAMYREMETSILEIVTQKAYWDEKYQTLKDGMMKEMVSAGEYQWKGEKLSVTRRKDSVSKRFDAERFKRDHPDMYSEYQTETTRTGSLTINKL